jgi:hypothetical protein
MTQRDKTLLASQSYAVGANNSAQIATEGAKGVRVFVEVTAVGGAGTVVVKLQIQDPGTGQWHDLPSAVTASIVAIGRKVLTVYPGIAETANESVSDIVTGALRAVATVGGNAVTLSVNAALLD